MKTRLLAATALFLCAGHAAAATTISLDFTTLPSAQGWQFVGQDTFETSAFSVDGTTLRQNTIGSGSSGFAYYQIPNIVDVTQGYSIDVRARVLNKENDPGRAWGAVSFSATDSALYSRFSLGQNELEIESLGPNPLIAFDNTSFHDYRLVVTPSKSYTAFFILIKSSYKLIRMIYIPYGIILCNR